MAEKKTAGSTKSKPAKSVNKDAQPKKTHSKSVAHGNKRKVLFVGSEAFPFAGTGGLGEVLGSLPRAINNSDDYEARVILPLYGSFPENRRKDLEFVCWTFVELSWRHQYCGLFRIKEGNTVFYFIDNEYYFKRSGLYGHGDDGERFAFFCRAVLELLPRLDFMPDVLHCNDWQTALVPIYYKLFYMYRDGYGGIKTVFTIHNIEYQGWYNRSIIEDVFGIPDREYGSLEHFGEINLMKAAIDYSDAVSTVSPTYAKEIMTMEYSHGLDGDLVRNAHKLRGILNGIDTDTYNPQTNPALYAHYNVTDKRGKAINKAGLQKQLWLPVRQDVPVIAMITRLASHKGLDIVKAALPELLSRDVQVIVLGTGDWEYEQYFTHMQEAYDGKMRALIEFNKDLSHKIYAGADMFLMPSRSEPCGLSQMMACRYGTIPIVRETGGLKDSIVDAYNGDFGNGYKFERYAADDLLNALNRAIGLYSHYHDKWEGLVDRAMRTDFGWNNSAKEYVKFYNELLG
ncbi:MAG: glycogen synthase GlgA [Ruminococcus sp.]|nr:glycogen synthase GlgA [Ruminococcus sp.]